KEQEAIVKRAAKALRLLPGARKLRAYIRETLAKTHSLQIRNWTISWQLPETTVVCTNNVLCITSSNLSRLVEYRTHDAELRDMAFDVIAHLKQLKGGKVGNLEKGLQRWALRQ